MYMYERTCNCKKYLRTNYLHSNIYTQKLVTKYCKSGFIGTAVILGRLGQMSDSPKIMSVPKNKFTVNFYINIGPTYLYYTCTNYGILA